jgi:hypothetical protein
LCHRASIDARTRSHDAARSYVPGLAIAY